MVDSSVVVVVTIPEVVVVQAMLVSWTLRNNLIRKSLEIYSIK